MNWNILSPRTNFSIIAPADVTARRIGSFGPTNGAESLPPKPRNKFPVSSLLKENSDAANPTFEADDINVNRTAPNIQRNGREGTRTRPTTLDKQNGLENQVRLQDVCITEGDEFTDKLTEENASLLEELDESRKKSLGLKVSTAFALAGFRHQRRFSEDLKKAKRKKEEEAAARMILHNLLLNSWRNCKSELDSLENDNTQLNKSVENLQLQLRVMRHMQSAEREKTMEKIQTMEIMKSNISVLEEDKRRSRIEMEKMEGELNDIQANIEKLKEENAKFEETVSKLIEENSNLGMSLDTEKGKSAKNENLYEALKEESEDFESRLKEISSQTDQWKERARAFESEAWELRVKMEGKDSQIRDIQSACDALNQEKLKILKSKTSLKEQLDSTLGRLETTDKDKTELRCKIEKANSRIRGQANKIESLESALSAAKKEYTDIERELLSYKVQNVKRRRDWANALQFVVDPLGAFQRSFHSSNDKMACRHTTRASL